MNRFLILTDFAVKPEWEFLAGFREVCGEEPDVHSCTSNYLRRGIIDRIRRYLLYFTFPLSQLKYNGKYESIVGFQQFYALNLAFFMKLLGIRKRSRIYVMTFIYKDKKGLAGKLYRRYVKSIVTSGYVDRFFVSSSSEPAYYASLFGCREEVFVPCRLGIDRMEGIEPVKGSYFFAAGRSNRDYDFLISEFTSNGRELTIVTDEPLKSPVANISILGNCTGTDMFRKMAASYCVIIPLKDPNISAGQLVALQALQLGKPVIATRCPGLYDYLEDGTTALLTDNTGEGLERCMKALADDSVYARLSKNARKAFNSRFSLKGQGAFVCKKCLEKE